MKFGFVGFYMSLKLEQKKSNWKFYFVVQLRLCSVRLIPYNILICVHESNIHPRFCDILVSMSPGLRGGNPSQFKSGERNSERSEAPHSSSVQEYFYEQQL